ncbi:MAG: DNA polymerase III subunit beta [Actinomycetota bacterium]
MRLTVARDELAAKLALAGRVASSKTTIPILSHVALVAQEGVVELRSTDMELSLRLPLEAAVEEAGAVVLPRLASDIVRTLAEGSVLVEHKTGEGSATIAAGGSSFTLNCLQESEYPALPVDEGTGVEIPASVLGGTAERVVRAASRDESRPVLTGVLVRMGSDGLTMVATDSYRLAVKQTPLDTPPAQPLEAIVPARALVEVGRLVSALGADTVEIVLGADSALFRIGAARLTSRLIDGQFPDYRQLLPDRFEHELVFDRAELLAVLTRIGVLAQRAAPIRLLLQEGSMTVAAISEQLGQGRETIPTAFTGDPVEIGFNADFLRDGVDGIEGEEVRIGLISPLRPGLLRGANGDYRYLIMPIRLNA